MVLLHELNLNFIVGYVETRTDEGELLKETFDIKHSELPCIRLVKDGLFHHQKFFQTTFSLDAYTGFVEAVEGGYNVS